MLIQIIGATLANGTLRLLFLDGNHDHFVGTVPSGSNWQAFIVEFIIAFYLMFVVCGVATDNRAVLNLLFFHSNSHRIFDTLFENFILL